MTVAKVREIARAHVSLKCRNDGLFVAIGQDAAWAAAGLDPRDFLGETTRGRDARIFGDELHRLCLRLVEAAEARS